MAPSYVHTSTVLSLLPTYMQVAENTVMNSFANDRSTRVASSGDCVMSEVSRFSLLTYTIIIHRNQVGVNNL